VSAALTPVTDPNNTTDFEERGIQKIISSAMDAPPDIVGISFSAMSNEVEDSRGKRLINVNLLIDAANLQVRDSGDHKVVSLRVTVFYADSMAHLLGADWRKADLRLTAEIYSRMVESGISCSITMPKKSPGQWIKVVVLDTGSRHVGSRSLQRK
jgi:hypothetical protein